MYWTKFMECTECIEISVWISLSVLRYVCGSMWIALSILGYRYSVHIVHWDKCTECIGISAWNVLG